MSDDERDLALGRLVREQRESSQELALLHAEAQRLGSLLITIGGSLQIRPQTIYFDGQIRYPEFAVSGSPNYKDDDFTPEKIRKLVENLRSCLLKRSKIAESLKQYGM